MFAQGGDATHMGAGNGGTANINRHRIRQVPFVVLHNERDRRQVVAVFLHVVKEVSHRFDIRLRSRNLAVRNEHDSVHTLQDELPRCIVIHLPRNGVEMEADFEPAN